MRGQQLSAIAQRSPIAGRGVGYRAHTDPFRRSTLFLTKGVLKSVGPDILESWRRSGNRLYLDPVDEDLSDEIATAGDVIVASSFTAADDYRRRWPGADVRLLHHHVDPRVEALHGGRPHASFRAAYFGELLNTVRSPALERAVDFTLVDTSRRDDSWLKKMTGASLHFAVRRSRELDRHKPFLKGFTAAACGANILIQDSEPEPRRWLPPDYPFLLRGPVTEASILTALEAARAAFGTAQWRDGLDAMREIAHRTSTDAIARDLAAVIY
jgi:hypothetical protein